MNINKNNRLVFMNFFAVFLMLSFSCPALVFPIQPDGYESDDTFRQAKVIVIDSADPRHHTFHKPEDADWIKFYGLSSVKKYSIEARNLGKDCDVRLEIYDKDGISLLEYKDSMGDIHAEEILEYSFWRDGIYYVKVIWSEPGTPGEDAETGYDLRVRIPDAPVSSQFQGSAVNAVSKAPLGDAMIKTDQNITALSDENADGNYTMYHPVSSSSDPYTLTAELPGYETFTVKVFTSESCTGGKTCFKRPAESGGTGQRTDPVEWNGVIELVPLKGDINGDFKVDLADAVLGLQIVAGIESGNIRQDYIGSHTDVSGDNKVGMEEVLHILNKTGALETES